ncbi:multisubunit potassium/proton antiporter, PhaG subunit [Roseovarius azorensis]|uniref:Multisubunit potassium/proton antiporter, PhaG subunit n=1 Tax=Roseovarius azorensis TaxID=1287727 RepID=A0A1H7FRU9_9RHOB|nr:Na+/H+ antiporter subunit G [Roseovarius azorensis]SEK27222.1 multisubunit potassium/proton antiporter, PhaG subunit [Roseovarius azorensis]
MLVEILISVSLVISGIFGLVGSFGMIKLPDPMMRLHAPTKATTLGVGGALIASMLYFYFVVGQLSFHELMITLFLFLTAPITGHFIAKTHLHLNHKPSDLPPTGTERPWASYESDAERQRIEAAAEAGDTPR